jgi:peptidoglycan hydrolase-like protein with peptidoglycan-binding domain
MLHHTASSARSGDSGALGICINGRSDLPGPLCNLHVSRSGVITVVSLNLANHAGKGSRRVLDETKRGVAPSGDARARGLTDDVGGNGYYIGVEIENDGVGEQATAQQIDAIIRMSAAICRLQGWPAEKIVLHREWSKRKPDHALRLDWRGMTRARLDGQPVPVPTPEPYSPQQGYMRLGSRGQTVANLQAKLGITADGVFGPMTDKAVKAFQRAKGLEADGIVGPKTLAALASLQQPLSPADAAHVAHNEAVAPAAPPVPTWWKRTLRQGSRGTDVKALQRALGLKDDGIFGPATHAAVVGFQRTAGLAADGIVGPMTARRLRAVPAPAPAPTKPTWYSRVLRQGSKGNDVKQVQRIVGAAQDGYFGPATKRKVAAWQRLHGLTGDGVVGPATASKMIGR